MLYISDKFYYQNQQKNPDISHFTLMYKSCHTSCRLHIVPIRFVSNVVQSQSNACRKNEKSWAALGHNMQLKMYIKNI